MYRYCSKRLGAKLLVSHTRSTSLTTLCSPSPPAAALPSCPGTPLSLSSLPLQSPSHPTSSSRSSTRSASPSVSQSAIRLSPSLMLQSDNAPDSLEPIQGVPAEIYLWWPSWSARRRMSGLRRWMLDVEWKEGGFSTWSTSVMSDWAIHRADGEDGKDWSTSYTHKIRIGHLILQYLSRVMDGQLLGGLGTCELTLQEECRDLSLQIHQLSTPVTSAVAGLEVSLKWIHL